MIDRARKNIAMAFPGAVRSLEATIGVFYITRRIHGNTAPKKSNEEKITV